MSQNLYFQPASPQIVDTSCPNQTIETLERAFGRFPITLDNGAIATLHGMQAADPNNTAWEFLINELHEHGTIILTTG